jgi:hypothetical protein
VTVAEWFRWKRVAATVYHDPLHTSLLGVTEHHTIIKSEMTFVSGWSLQLQCLKKGIYLIR